MDNQMFAHSVADTEDKSFAGTEKVENNFFIGSVHDVAICMGGGGRKVNDPGKILNKLKCNFKANHFFQESYPKGGIRIRITIKTLLDE